MRAASTLVPLLFALSVLAVPGLSRAQTQPQSQTPDTRPEQQTKADDATPIVYKPPMRGAPARRVGGATRGASDKDLVLNVLAPEQTGLTMQAQPTLYWYVSKPSNTTLELTLIADAAEKPVFSQNVAVTQPGVQAIDLAQRGVTLAPDTDYEWFVSVVTDATQRSKDITRGGVIRRVAVDPAVQSRAAAAGARGAARVYADAGLWYDAIAALSRQIDSNPADAALRAQRAELLKQIGLPPMADK